MDFLVVLAQAATENVSEVASTGGEIDWERWGIPASIGVNLLFIVGVLKKFFKNKGVQKAAVGLQNIDTLTDKTLDEILDARLEALYKKLESRDEEGWKRHDECHKRIEGNQVLMKQDLATVKQDVAYLKGKAEII